MTCSLSAIIHSHHQLSNGELKSSYRHILQQPDLVDTLIILTDEQWQDLQQEGFPHKQMAVIPNHLDNSNIPAAPQKIPSQTVIYLARYSEEKQHTLLLSAFRQVVAAIPGARICSFGHMGDGNIHYNISQPIGADKQAFLERWREINHLVHGIVLAHDGSISAEHGIGQLKRDELAAVRAPIEMDLMRRVKHAFDPAGIMNPGKVVSD